MCGLFRLARLRRGRRRNRGWSLWQYFQLLEQERVHIDRALNSLIDRAAGTVAAVGVCAEVGAGANALQHRRHLSTLHRIDARVICTGQEENWWISCTLSDVVIRRVLQKGFELRLVADASELDGIESPVRAQFNAEHVVDANMAHHAREQIGMLRERSAHQQPAVAASFDRELIA